MTRRKSWEVDVYVAEDDRETRARAVLRRASREPVVGYGVARRNPHDEQVPAIGEELACARALHELAERVLELAAQDIEAVEGRPVVLAY